jgi:hypothetical protein
MKSHITVVLSQDDVQLILTALTALFCEGCKTEESMAMYERLRKLADTYYVAPHA